MSAPRRRASRPRTTGSGSWHPHRAPIFRRPAMPNRPRAVGALSASWIALSTAPLFMAVAAVGQQAESLPRVVPYPLIEPAAYRESLGVTRSPEGRPTEAYWQDEIAYDLEVTLLPNDAELRGVAKLTYTNRSPSPLPNLVIHLRQNLHKEGAQRTRDVEVTGGVEIGEVKVNGDAPRRRPRVRDTRLYVTLDEPLETGGSATVELKWNFIVPRAGRAPRMGHEGDNVFYLGYWYPQFAVRDDINGWVADRYRGNGEFYMPYATYDVRFSAPQGYIVRCTGELTNPEAVLTEAAAKALARAKTTTEIVSIVSKADLEAGDATPLGIDGMLTWNFRADNVRDVAVSCANTYVWDATHAVVPGRDEPVMIHAVYEPNATAWDRAAEFTKHAIEYMSKTVYPYPWPHMTACEGVIGGGMEYPMMTIVGSSRNHSAVQGTIAHETIHMWFPMIVGTNEKRYAWQDEGFTSFWTALCGDDFWGRETGTQRGILRYVGSVTRGGDAVCMSHGDNYAEGGFGFASYSKCAAILHQLRGVMGPEVFGKAFRAYTEAWAFKHPAPWDFFRSFSQSAGEDLGWYFRQWYWETWTLDHAVAAVEIGSDASVVTIADRGLALHPTVVEVTYVSGKVERKTIPVSAWMAGPRSIDLPFEGGISTVQIDPDFTSLDVDTDNNEWKKVE